LDEPDIIAPPSVESPTRAVGMPLVNTFEDPTLITAECGTHAGPAGMVCGEVGSPCRSTPILFANTLPDGPVTVVTASHPCPVVVGSPSLTIAGIIMRNVGLCQAYTAD
jgi:hypothetical protein